MQSPSSILTYKRGDGFKWGCPRKYYLRYIKKLKQKPKPELIIGTILHSAIQEFIDSFDFNNLEGDYGEDRRKALGLVRRKLEKEKWELAKSCANQFHYKHHVAESEKMMLNWYHQFLKDAISGRGPPKPETRIISERLMVQGIIDAIYNRGKISELRDYKTSKNDEITQDIKLQLAIYSILYREQNGQFPDKVSIHFLKYPPSKNNPRVFKPTQELVEWAEQEIREIHKVTSSENEEDYPCLCGGRCEEDFIEVKS